MLTIELLGPFRVRVDGRTVAQDGWPRRDPASLVKLLALRPDRRLHREQVMDLLWPDLGPGEAAPRLHKAAHYARRTLGREDAVVLRDGMVALLPGVPVCVDAEQFERAARAALADGSVAAAAAVLDRHPAEPLPADVYAEWADEPRDRLTTLRTRLLRQAGRWDELLALDPADEEAHLGLMRELARAGDRAGALRRFETLDRTVRRHLGTGPGREATALRDRLLASMRDRGGPPAVDERRLEQRIRFCRTRDGVTLAHARSGSGPPLVKAANWLTHLDHDWHSPVWRHWLVELSRRHTLVRYDERGCGLSDRDVASSTFEDWVADLEAVVDAAGLDRFPVLGISQGGPVAVTYAARHPERVTRLVLYGSYLQGRLVRATTEEDRAEHRLQVELARLGWGRDEPAFRQVFTSQFMPQGSRELWDRFNDLQRASTSAANAAHLLGVTGSIDAVEAATRVQAPTLVLHARHDQRPPFEQGRLAASLIPGSRFVALDSHNHLLLADEPAWPVFLREVEAFLAE
ncbi:alpha/beta fold hydrolase [Trujillonella humicola]|uniref:alpha/beta fold hydrolase n=1 Tax=Trujillonella humicola TaxID=3383699 RepID=UPI003905EB83